ncbi:VOC family protein [Histidinibacterium aquaticum]|uniref:VOC family protein n=1 Tax=Histidinibacterium aquaticum TaxID=2613962 RepID=A0A5J5GPT8_9RHOB|nr:VOC family protein [Histidinibacterium aquaticum]KAA9010386.1 VOC family protein [Histidinibacterium aquaticum]
MADLVPHLWFDDDALDAVEFYTSLLPDSRIVNVANAPDEGGVLVVTFILQGQPYAALNGGPRFPHTEAFSLALTCDDQEETDRYWTALTADGGSEHMCGWCRDRFGVHWQVVPRRLHALLADPDPGRARRAMEAMLTMRRIDVAALEAAAAG